MSWIVFGMRPRQQKDKNEQKSFKDWCEIFEKGLQETPLKCRILLLVKMNRVLGSVMVHENLC